MMFKIWNTSSFTLTELVVVVSIIGILAAIAIQNYIHARVGGRVELAERDAKVFVAAVEIFRKETGRLPSNLEELTGPMVDTKNQTVGPILQSLPRPPAGWTYTYYLGPYRRTFTIVMEGDQRILRFPK